MFTTRKRNLYVGIIMFCVLVSALVWVTRKGTTPASTQIVGDQPAALGNQADNRSSQSNTQTTPAPIVVYPKNNTFDTAFFESSTYKLLKPFKTVEVKESELGVEDPFKPF